MREKLTQLLQHAYCPYSNYPVSAIVVMYDGKMFGGVNIENASYGATICAERNAISSAIAAGYQKEDFRELYVMVTGDKPAFPCFLCRQTIVEFFHKDCKLVIMNQNYEEHYFISDIAPHPFTSEDLK